MLILVFLIVIRLPWIPTTTQPPRTQKAPRLLGHFKQVTSSALLSWPAKDKALVTAALSAGAATASRNVSPWMAACRLPALPGLRPPLTNTLRSSSRRTSTCSEAPAKPPRTATSSCKRVAATTEPCRSPVTVSPWRAAGKHWRRKGRNTPGPGKGLPGTWGVAAWQNKPYRGQGDLARLRRAAPSRRSEDRRAPRISSFPAGSGARDARGKPPFPRGPLSGDLNRNFRMRATRSRKALVLEQCGELRGNRDRNRNSGAPGCAMYSPRTRFSTERISGKFHRNHHFSR